MIWLVRFWKPAVAVVGALAIWLALQQFGARKFDEGYAKAVAENAAALVEWQKKYDAKVKEDADRLASARRNHEAELAILARPVHMPRVMCRASPAGGAGGVPASADVQSGGTTSAGILDRADAQDFDPSAQLADYAADAEYLTVNCRNLHMQVHGTPSAP